MSDSSHHYNPTDSGNGISSQSPVSRVTPRGSHPSLATETPVSAAATDEASHQPLCDRSKIKQEEHNPLSAQSALSHLQTCIADRDLASQVELFVKEGKGKRRYTNRNFTVREPEDERVEAYARSVLQEAESRASLAYNTATSICGTEAVSMLGGIAGPETLDECDAAGRKFESRVQECYEAIYGPKNPDEPVWHLWREVDDSTAETKQEEG